MTDRSLFNAEDFLVDPTFQAYCAGTDIRATDYWEKWVRAHPEKRSEILEAKKLYLILSGQKKPLNRQVELLKEKTRKAKTPVVARMAGKYTWLRVAAAVTVLFLLALFLHDRYSDEPRATDAPMHFSTAAGERKKIKLPDGSVILLNAKSSLSVDKTFNTKDRKVSLIGEAYFEVSRNKEKPFRVLTKDFDINVLGTTFNVRVYPGEGTSEATLIKGVIRMEAKGTRGNSITLRPSQKVIFRKKPENAQLHNTAKHTFPEPEITINTYTLAKDSSIAEMAWTHNRLEIMDQDFSEVGRALERWYDVEICFASPEIEKYRFTATFNDENIEEVLNALQKAEHFKYEIKGKKITLSK